MYQLRIACLGSNAASERRTPTPRLGRNAATGGTDMITALANGLSGIAASPEAAIAPQS